MSLTKRAYLVVDDYGMGGIWFYVRATSADEVRATLPTTVVFESDTRPDWMSDEMATEIARERTYDIDALPENDWMNGLRSTGA